MRKRLREGQTCKSEVSPHAPRGNPDSEKSLSIFVQKIIPAAVQFSLNTLECALVNFPSVNKLNFVVISRTKQLICIYMWTHTQAFERGKLRSVCLSQQFYTKFVFYIGTLNTEGYTTGE